MLHNDLDLPQLDDLNIVSRDFSPGLEPGAGSDNNNATENDIVINLFEPFQTPTLDPNLNRLLENLDINIKNFVLENYDVLKTNPTQMKLLELMLYYLRSLRTLLSQNDLLLLDFYFTVNSVYQLIIKESQELPGASIQASNLQTSLMAFLTVRETLLRGDSHDYCYNWSLANQFCVDVVQVVFPKEGPLNILLQQARTQNRTTPWQDLTTLDEDLASPEDFFRTKNDAIHLYQAVVDRAIEHLKAGYSQIEHIWLGTDLKDLNPLGMENLEILKQRSKTLKDLIDYSVQLTSVNENVFKRFCSLRRGFLAGSFLFFAGPSAYKAQKDFFAWWWNLDKTMEGKQIKNKINEIANIKIFVDNLEKANDYCVLEMAGDLSRLLKDNATQTALRKIGTDHVYLTHERLDQMRNTILDELKTFRDIKTDQCLFDKLQSSKSFIQFCMKNPSQASFNHLPELIAQFNISMPSGSTFLNPISPQGVPQAIQIANNYPQMPAPAEKKQHKHGFFKHKEKSKEIKQQITYDRKPFF